jgi:hypothetical protein
MAYRAFGCHGKGPKNRRFLQKLRNSADHFYSVRLRRCGDGKAPKPAESLIGHTPGTFGRLQHLGRVLSSAWAVPLKGVLDGPEIIFG